MKCWKCGADIPDNASVCTYCSASMARKAPVTDAGKALRQIYDRFGCEKVFEKKSVLPIALGDLLDDSKKLRNQVEMVMSSGIGSVYLNQLRNSGKPDAAFNARVKTLITEEAGLSDKIATELMGYFDEMIGWNSASQTVSQSGGTTSRPQPASSREIPRPTSNTEIPRPEPNTEIPRPDPEQQKSPEGKPSIPLPNVDVPVFMVGCSGVMKQLVFIAIAIACGIGGFNMLMAGLWPVALALFAAALFLFKLTLSYETFPGEKKIKCVKTSVCVALTWEGAMDKFAVAIDGKWVLTGSGTKAVLKNDLFVPYPAGKKVRITVAEIIGSSVELRGQTDYECPKR